MGIYTHVQVFEILFSFMYALSVSVCTQIYMCAYIICMYLGVSTWLLYMCLCVYVCVRVILMHAYGNVHIK